ncbi:hypothetical protein Ciccas_014500, partial [Cichlidogyrus casuarinus]
MWARAVKWFASYHCLTNKQSFEALALSLTCIPQSNDRRDVIEAIVREAETAERPFDSLLDNVVATQRKLAEKDLLVILEGIKKSDEPPSVKYRRLAAVAADETQQLSLWKSMLGPLQQHLMSMYLDLKPDALIDEVLKRADDLVAIERATVGPSNSVASRHCCSISIGETLQGTAAGPSVLAASQQCYPTSDINLLGMDFLSHFSLSIDPAKGILRSPIGKIKLKCKLVKHVPGFFSVTKSVAPHADAHNVDQRLAMIIAPYSRLFCDAERLSHVFSKKRETDVEHCIEVMDKPCHARLRRLQGPKLEA